MMDQSRTGIKQNASGLPGTPSVLLPWLLRRLGSELQFMTYDWLAGLVFFAALSVATALGHFIAFRVPALRKMREMNIEADEPKMARPSYREAVRVNNKAASLQALGFYALIMPFCVSFEAMPFWRYVVDIVAVLMIYDFSYYLTHRFLFHGKLLRKVHALHHQSRTPVHIDAMYVHPIETVIGLALFLFSIPLIAALTGGPLNALSMAVATLIFTQWNTLNHAFVNLPYFPFRAVDRITSIHAAHHVDMNQGNFATITMLYDRLFGTFEEPVSRSTP